MDSETKTTKAAERAQERRGWSPEPQKPAVVTIPEPVINLLEFEKSGIIEATGAAGFRAWVRITKKADEHRRLTTEEWKNLYRAFLTEPA
jgi:hypothetical protein